MLREKSYHNMSNFDKLLEINKQADYCSTN